MAYTEEVLSAAKTRLEQSRGAHQQAEYARLHEIFQKSPRLLEIDRSLRKTSAQILAATFRSNQNPAEAIAKIREENQALQQERVWILETEGLELSDLEISPICPDCGGTGYRGAAMCSCLRELCRQEQKKELAQMLGSNYESFDRFRLDVYSDAVNPTFRTSPRALMQIMYRRAVSYAQSFSPNSGSLLFSGATGLGKTFLSACIARAVADQGYSVCYVTAEKLFADFEAEKFHPSSDRNGTERYRMCDLLILDDLGTEMTTQFSIAALYQIINFRLTARKPTIVSTNLTPDSFDSRYSAPIASRLNGSFELFQFCGDDIRMKLRNKAK